jgi:hypothetical protein
MAIKSIGNDLRDRRGSSFSQCDNGKVRETRAALASPE